jgi:hypothetical protein
VAFRQAAETGRRRGYWGLPAQRAVLKSVTEPLAQTVTDFAPHEDPSASLHQLLATSASACACRCEILLGCLSRLPLAQAHPSGQRPDAQVRDLPQRLALEIRAHARFCSTRCRQKDYRRRRAVAGQPRKAHQRVIKERLAAENPEPPAVDTRGAQVRPITLAEARTIIEKFEPMPAVSRYCFGIFFGDRLGGICSLRRRIR